VISHDANLGRLSAIRDSIWRTADALPTHEDVLATTMNRKAF